MPLPDRSKLTPEQIVIMDKITVMPIAKHTFGVCHHGNHGKPFKTVEVLADEKRNAANKAWDLNDNKLLYTVCYIKTDPNPERVKFMKEVGWL